MDLSGSAGSIRDRCSICGTSATSSSAGARARSSRCVGLGLGVALVVAIASLSKGLDRAQKKTLDPLAGIGTDLTVTLQPQQQQTQGFGGFGGGGPGGGGNRDLIQSNLSVLTDLSKLGKPGTHFVHDFFLPGHAAHVPAERRAADRVARRRAAR